MEEVYQLDDTKEDIPLAGSRYVSVENLELESDEDYKKRWLSIRILYVTMFFDSLSFSIVLSSIWPYLQKINPDPGLNPIYVAWANIGFQLAGIFMDFVMGFWTNKRGSTEPLLVSLFLFGFGNLMYGYAEAVGGFGINMVLLSRTIIGLSTGVNVVARAVTAESTSLKERTTVMAHMSIAQGVGFSFGPAIQLAAVPLGDQGVYIEALKLHLNLYTAPAFVSILIAACNAIAVIGWYHEYHIDIYKDHHGDEEIEKYKTLVRHHGLQKTNHDALAVVANLFLYFIVQSAFALDETLLSPLAMAELAWTREETALWVSLIFFGAGMIAIIVFAITDVLEQIFNERAILLFGFVVLLLGFTVFLPWGNEYPKIKPAASSLRIANDTFTSNNTINLKDLVGCPVEYSWCENTPKIYLFQIIMAMSFLAIGYPFAMVLTTTIYSKILGPSPQGLMQSWLAAVGGLARTAGPAIVTYMYVAIGPRWTFLSVDGLILISILVLILSYKRLIPYHLFILKKNENKVRLLTNNDYALTESTDSGMSHISDRGSLKDEAFKVEYFTVV